MLPSPYICIGCLAPMMARGPVVDSHHPDRYHHAAPRLEDPARLAGGGGDVRITGLRLRQLTGIMEHEEPFWEERLQRPIDVYPEYKAQRARPGFWMPQPIDTHRSRVISIFLEIDTDEGVTGRAGPIPHEVAYIEANYDDGTCGSAADLTAAPGSTPAASSS